MDEKSHKLKLYYKPYLLIVLGLTVGYTFLHWLLVIQFHLAIDEIIVNFIVPIAISIISLLVWLNPNLRKLSYVSKGRGDKASFFFFFAAITTITPTIIFQFYIDTATGKLTNLQTISELNSKPITKYYTIKNFLINKSLGNDFTMITVSNKYSQYNMDMYFVFPILNAVSDTIDKKCMAWAGVRYSLQISNNLTGEEKEKSLNEFATDNVRKINECDLYSFKYLVQPGYNKHRNGYLHAIKNSSYTSALTNNIIVLEFSNEPFEDRNGEKLLWFLLTFFIGHSLFIYGISNESIKHATLKEYEQKHIEV